HPTVATSLNNLAALYESTGDTDRALPLYQRSIDILEKVLGSEHPSTITVKENMNKLVLKLK
ncbi:MAG: tetratricopeptide repeat protein, partial [Saprospiraceae bacterium]|nr:tetratricopeptide repeat protein [Saprospiraceae bacterium]